MRRRRGGAHPGSSRYLLLYGGKFPLDSSWDIKTPTAPFKSPPGCGIEPEEGICAWLSCSRAGEARDASCGIVVTMTPRTSSRENSAGNICGTKLRVLGGALPYARRSFAYRLTPWLLKNWNWSCKLSPRNHSRFQEGASRGVLGWGLGRFIPNDALTLLIQQLWSCPLRNNPGGSWDGKASEPWKCC